MACVAIFWKNNSIKNSSDTLCCAFIWRMWKSVKILKSQHLSWSRRSSATEPPWVSRDPSYSHEYHMPADHAGYQPWSFPFQNNLAMVQWGHRVNYWVSHWTFNYDRTVNLRLNVSHQYQWHRSQKLLAKYSCCVARLCLISQDRAVKSSLDHFTLCSR